MIEVVSITGRVIIEMRKHKQWVKLCEGDNLVLSAGKTNTERLLSGDPAGKPISFIAVGISGTPALPTDTVITSQVKKVIESTEFLSGNTVAFVATLQGSDPAMTIREVGLLNADNVLCHRKVFDPPKVKAAGLSYRITYQVKIS